MMLSKVTKRVRRHSFQASDVTNPALQETKRESVQVAPDLIRWGNFTDPFPQVALGGYIRYYSALKPGSPTSPAYSPILSHYPDPAPSRETPPASPLFKTPLTPPLKRNLTVIREVSVESMSHKKPQNLVINTRTSLRRRRRTLLRTPSIERDFAVNLGHIFASSNSNMSVNDVSSVEASLSHGSSHSKNSSLSSSSESHFDFGQHPDPSNGSEMPITPSTSVDSDDEGAMLARLYLEKAEEMEQETSNPKQEVSSIPSRPESISSFSTAQSEFDHDDASDK